MLHQNFRYFGFGRFLKRKNLGNFLKNGNFGFRLRQIFKKWKLLFLAGKFLKSGNCGFQLRQKIILKKNFGFGFSKNLDFGATLF